MVAEPESVYVTHFTPVLGKAVDQISVAIGYGDSVCVLGCNGAADNTGKSGGIAGYSC